jgi:beta-carotene ketolase (CrtW type)
MLMVAWAATHIYGVFLHRWTPVGVAVAPLLIALQCWLNVGLFIVAHDCMHGSLAPGRTRLNRAVGSLALLLYAGFSYDKLLPKHLLHHRHAGTEADPDFDADHPDRFWPWYRRFLLRYFGWREAATLTALFWFYLLVIGAEPLNAALLWGVPAILSSLQLFYFGIYLPHRSDVQPFADRHRARSSDLSHLTSLLTCFHFGYHHEHHRKPWLSWWQLPAARQGRARPR